MEAMLARFAPFDGDKGSAMDWLVADTWEPPTDASDETLLWEDRFALAVFYYATTGDGWINNDGWLTAESVCSWNGIFGCNGDASVTKMRLRNSAMVGDLPDEMRAMTNLEFLGVEHNRYLSGSIPSFVTELSKLTLFNLGDTGRIGTIPSELWTLTKLQTLIFYGNFLSGSIPPGFSALTDLNWFAFPFNDLTGSLPNEFSRMSQLTHIAVYENFMTGTIPPLPAGLSSCRLGRHSGFRKVEGNCFTDTANVPSFCDLSANC